MSNQPRASGGQTASECVTARWPARRHLAAALIESESTASIGLYPELSSTGRAAALAVGFDRPARTATRPPGRGGKPSLWTELPERLACPFRSCSCSPVTSASRIASTALARAEVVALGAVLVVLVLLVGLRRGSDYGAFAVAFAAALLLSPIVWMHYYVLLVVPIAIAQPRLGVLWLAPLLYWASPEL